LIPLHLASQEGYDDIVQLLLDHGADANREDSHGSTPLHLASQEGHDHIVRLLLNHVVDANAEGGNATFHGF
jgi:ankyrin repeat protein